MTEIVKSQTTTPQVYDSEALSLIKNTILKPKNRMSTDAELQFFAKQCERTGLDPFSRQIYGIFRSQKVGNGYVEQMTVQTSIDGFRVIAERSSNYAGQTEVLWCGDDGIWRDVWLAKTPPRAAKVGVLRKDFAQPIYAIALFDEYCVFYERKPQGLWAKMPTLMIAKCAEALALRKAFPNDLSGLYTVEEFGENEENVSGDRSASEFVESAEQPRAVRQAPKIAQVAEVTAPKAEIPTPVQPEIVGVPVVEIIEPEAEQKPKSPMTGFVPPRQAPTVALNGATEKQLALIAKLIKDKSLADMDLIQVFTDANIADATDLDSLTKAQASLLISHLKHI
jgi:phage recombination protein Bet